MQVRLQQRHKEALTGWLFISPAIAGFGTLTIAPILFSLAISFTDWNFLNGLQGMRFTGVHNYTAMWTDKWFTDSLHNNFVFTVATVPVIAVAALLTAAALNQGAFFKTTLRLIIFMPYVTSIVAISLIWGLLYSPRQGPVNELLKYMGVVHPPGWLADTAWALPAVIIMSIWASIGFNMVIYLAGLQNIPKDLYEASNIDGAGVIQQFFNITLPMLSPTTLFVLITAIIHSFQVFGAVFVMTQGGPGTSTSVLTFYIYQAAFSFYKMGYASAMAWVLFILIFLVTIVQWAGQKRWVHY